MTTAWEVDRRQRAKCAATSNQLIFQTDGRWLPTDEIDAPASAQGSPKPEHAKLRIVIAEDNRGDVLLVREALTFHGLEFDLAVQRDGEEMWRFIQSVDAGEMPCPDVVLLDLNLPKRNGETLLARIRESAVCSHVPVIIVTSSDAPRDREAVARLGASMYFRKPTDFDEFMYLGRVVRNAVRGEA